jgi:hypothetical protein
VRNSVQDELCGLTPKSHESEEEVSWLQAEAATLRSVPLQLAATSECDSLSLATTTTMQEQRSQFARESVAELRNALEARQ